MIKNITKGIVTLSLFAFLFFPSFLNAQDGHFDWYTNTGDKGNLHLKENLEPRDAAVRIINLVLSFLGLVAVAIVLIGGFKWMTAGGNEEKVGSAKKLLIGGLIGLIIVLVAWGITTWLLETIPNVAQ